MPHIIGFNEDVDIGVQGIEHTWREYKAPTPITNEETPLALIQGSLEKHYYETETPREIEISPHIKIISTAILTIIALLTAIFVPNVQCVWGFIGSSVTIIIAFFMPAICYLAVVWPSRYKIDIYTLYSIFSGVVAVFLMVLSTFAYFYNLSGYTS
jgi:hypothetical protein